MLVLILLFYFVPGTLTGTIPQISTLFSTDFKEASAYSPSGASTLLSAVPRDVSTCTCPPNQRSTLDITWSCLAVVLACSWISVHPNIPAPEENWWRISIRRMECLLWTLMTPELIVCWAARQWIGARKIHGEQKDHGWTVTHGHFIQMGGFMLFKGKEIIGTLSYPGFCELLRRGQIKFPDITQKEIEDKSKSDGLSKALVVGQTGWFILQCIARGVRGLPITTLELLTLALAALNGFTYFFWWDKPFNVQCSVPVHLIVPTNTDVAVGMPESSNSENKVSMPEPTSDDEIRISISQDQVLPDSEGAQTEIPKFDQFHTRFLKWSGWHKIPWTLILDFIAWPLLLLIAWPLVLVLLGFFRLWEIAGETDNRQEYEETYKHVDDDTPGSMRAPTFYSLKYGSGPDDNFLFVVIPLIGSLYGAIHCAGWVFQFPTAVELWLWRISSVIIAVIPLLYLICVLSVIFDESWLVVAVGTCLDVLETAITWLVATVKTILPLPWTWLATAWDRWGPDALFIVFLPSMLYILARLILLVEAISTLRALPPGAFDVVQWTTFLPHI